MHTQTINFDFVGSCKGSCPSCTLSEYERAQPEAFLTGKQMTDAMRRILADKRPDRLVMAVGRANTLALNEAAHLHIFDVARAAGELAPQAHRVLEISTSLVEAPQKQKERALALVKGCQEADPGLEVRFVVVLDVSKKSAGYWRAIETFLRWMFEWRGGKDGDGDILALNVSLTALPDIPDLIRRVSYWRGPVNVQWLGSGEKSIDAEAVSAAEDWFHQLAMAAKAAGLDNNLLAVKELSRERHQDSILDVMRANIGRLAWMDRFGVVSEGSFTVIGDYAVGAAMKADEAARLMMRHPACRTCPQLQLCVTCGGFAAAAEVLKRVSVAAGVCPSMLRKTLASLGEASDG